MARRRNPISDRTLWIAGLAAAGVAIVGGVAYAVSKPSTTSSCGNVNLTVMPGGSYNVQVAAGGSVKILAQGATDLPSVTAQPTTSGSTGVKTNLFNYVVNYQSSTGQGGTSASSSTPSVLQISWNDANGQQSATVNVTGC